MVDIEKRGRNIPLPNQIPPWLLHFLVHVVKRCCMIIVKYIDDLQQEEKRK